MAEQQRGTLQLYLRVKGDDPVDIPDSVPGDSALDHSRVLVYASAHVERMDTMNVGSVLFGFCHHIAGPAVRIDDRSARDPNFWNEISAADIGTGYGRGTGSRIDETRMPQWEAGRMIGVEGVDAVMFSCHKDGIVELACHVQWLRIDLAIHRE